MDPRGFWVKPGPGYAPKYSGTVWNLMFLEQMGADPADERVQAACRYVLDHTTVATGGFGCSGSHLERQPSALQRPPLPEREPDTRPRSRFGHLDDPRVQAAVDWAARTITGEDVDRWYAYTPGPGFACGINEDLPCAWGAAKEMRALAAIPPRRRTARVKRAIALGVEFLLLPRPGRRRLPHGLGQHQALVVVVQARASPRATWPTCCRCSRCSPSRATAGIPAWSTPWPGWPAGRTPGGAGPTATPTRARPRCPSRRRASPPSG